jgi:hypothetical protein
MSDLQESSFLKTRDIYEKIAPNDEVANMPIPTDRQLASPKCSGLAACLVWKYFSLAMQVRIFVCL